MVLDTIGYRSGGRLRAHRCRHRVTREGVCFRAHGPAHPMDGSQPHRWARRTFLNGKSDDRRKGAPSPPAHMCHISPVRCELNICVCAHCTQVTRASPTAYDCAAADRTTETTSAASATAAAAPPSPSPPSPPPSPLPSPPPIAARRGTARGAARRVQGGQERPPAAWGRIGADKWS